MNGNVDFGHHHNPSSEGAIPFHTRLGTATRIDGSSPAQACAIGDTVRVNYERFNRSIVESAASLSFSAI